MANKDFKVKNGLDIQTPLPVSMGGTGQTSTTNTLNALLPPQVGNQNKYLSTDGTNPTWSQVTAGFTPTPSTAVSSNITLSAFNKYFVNTTAARTLTLPASPNLGDEIYVFDASGTAGTYNITIDRNGQLINGNAGNLIFNVSGSAISIIYTGSTYGWRIG
jgi:hypothetical protein